MKQGIHPDYHTIKVVWTDGSTTEMKSCYGKEGDTITLDVDPKTHAAWVGGIQIRKTGRVERFNNRFNAFDFTSAGSGKKEENKEDKKAS